MCYNKGQGDDAMRSYSSREVIKMLKADGWYEVHCVFLGG